MTRGRRREFGKAADIARLLSRGISYPTIAAQLELSTSQVKRRVQNLRLLLAKETGDQAWADIAGKTPVEVGQAFLARADDVVAPTGATDPT